MRKTMILLLTMLVALALFALPQQGGGAGAKSAVAQANPVEDRVSGTIMRISKDKSALVIKERRSGIERTVFYNDSTRWTKGKDTVDMQQFKDGSRVICLGKLNDKKELMATRIDLQ